MSKKNSKLKETNNIPEDKIITSEKLAVIRDEIINTCNEFTKNRIENNEL